MQQNTTEDEHGYCVEHPECDEVGVKEVADVTVWESELFTDETSNAVSYEKYSTEESGSVDGGISKKYDCENTKKEYSFEKYCKEGAWEVHRPMYLHGKRTCVWCIAGKFLIDPIP